NNKDNWKFVLPSTDDVQKQVTTSSGISKYSTADEHLKIRSASNISLSSRQPMSVKGTESLASSGAIIACDHNLPAIFKSGHHAIKELKAVAFCPEHTASAHPYDLELPPGARSPMGSPALVYEKVLSAIRKPTISDPKQLSEYSLTQQKS